MKWLLWVFLFLMAVWVFVVGMMVGNTKIITKREIHKVADFTQEPEVMEQYANVMGKTLKDNKTIVAEQLEAWKNGYEEGYKRAVREGTNAPLY